ncbi:MAG: NUDIX domain-containing protein [Promethearchaeia archaeon]
MKYEHSIGAIVYNDDEYLLLKYGMGHWGLVKGNREERESERETILRELKEETSIANGEIVEGFREKTDYFYKLKGETIHKFVVYLLIESETKEVELSYEHDDFKWLSFEEAVAKVNFGDVKDILKKAHKYITQSD